MAEHESGTGVATRGMAPREDLAAAGPSAMRVHLVFPELPPALDGIGDHTERLAQALAPRCCVSVLTARPDAAPIPGVAVREAFSVRPPTGVRRLVESVGQDPPDWLVLQYNPFSYGRYGFNPWLPRAIAAVRKNHPAMRFGLIIHEPFVPANTFSFRIMTTWQRWQLWTLGRAADLVVCSTETWAGRFGRWFPGATVRFLPVGSNIPDAGFSRAEARSALGIELGEMVVGLFGSARRRLDLVRAAARRLVEAVPSLRVLYVGPDGARLRDAVAGVPFRDLGALPAGEVSRALRAMDLHLAPYPRGVSARRGAFIAGLQHALPSVSTYGDHTDSFLTDAAGRAFVLAPDGDAAAFADAALALAQDEARRAKMAAEARAFHGLHFDWDQIAGGLLDALGEGQPERVVDQRPTGTGLGAR